MKHLYPFRMPTPMKVTGRSSTITNAFINSIIPVVFPTEEKVKEALSVLGMDKDSFCCSYCGTVASEWDHLRPLVLDKMPTGYISEIHNLVPSCGKCNQSKGNKPWRSWMFSTAALSPMSRGVANLDEKAAKLEAYENWEIPTKVDFENIVGKDTWIQHWNNCEQVQAAMKNAQVLADEIKSKVILSHTNQ